MPDENTRILLVCANPRGTNLLRTAEEDRTLRESIQLSPKRDHFEVETLNAATIDDLRRALLRKPFDVVHFSGHGTQTGLVFEDTLGRLMVPQSAALADLLQRRKVRVALLNACYSLSVGKIAAIGMDYTIASTGPISDPGAIEFTRGFYDALGAGTDVPDAYAEGISAARLKGFDVDAVLLRQGEEYIPKPTQLSSTTNRSAEPIGIRSLLGIAVDTSGSMQESIRNRSGEAISRFGGVKSALAEIGSQVREELTRRGAGTGDSFQVFVYAFGLRIGDGVADMASLWKAAHNVDLKREVEIRKQRHEAEARRKAAGYSGLASLARSYGLGGIVDSVTEAATNSIRDNIVGEVSSIILAESERLGDSTLTAETLAELFDSVPIDSDERLMDHILFGLTPMAEAAKRIRDRFVRAGSDVFDNRSLLVISDGVPTDGDPREPMREVRDSGISVIACFVTSDDIASPRVLHGTPVDSWPEGARLMWDISSAIDESGPAARYLLSNGWSIEPNARLFVQANHSDVLKEFVHVAGSHFTAETTSVLPRGR